MKRIMGMIIGIAVVGMSGCASPVIDQWADRNEQGVQYARQHIVNLTKQVSDCLQKSQTQDLERMDDELYEVVTGKLEGVTFDRQWLREHRAAITAILADTHDRQAALSADEMKALNNLNEISDGLRQIKRLRGAWTITDEMQAQISQLANLVQQLIAQQAAK